jgi:hypothetical protein
MSEVDVKAVQWLREQVQARLETARAAAQADGTHPAWEAPFGGDFLVDAADPDYAIIVGTLGEIAVHMALNDPQDVIARCEVELAILDEHQFDTTGKFGAPDRPRCLVCLTDRDGYEELWVADPWPCKTIQHVASGHRHRAGWAEHWGGGA